MIQLPEVKQGQKEEQKPIELVIDETRNRYIQIMRENNLGTAINRLILQEILTRLEREEQLILQDLRKAR